MSAPSGGGMPPCMSEFQRLRQDTEKRGAAAKAGSDKKVNREEMCKLVGAYADAEAKWVKYTVDNASVCSIPADAVKQIKGVHARTAAVRKQICSGGGGPGVAAAPAAPSLSEALGTTRIPTPETTKTGRGTLDTLTGNAIAR
jgi:hypothetical protein